MIYRNIYSTTAAGLLLEGWYGPFPTTCGLLAGYLLQGGLIPFMRA
jgi:hypothetical protein